MILSVRDQGFRGKIYAFVDSPAHRRPMVLAGATYAYTPKHVLAAALAAKASNKLSPRIIGIGELQPHLEVIELRIHADSELVGRPLGAARIREKTGATIVGIWERDAVNFSPSAETRLERGTIVLAVGSPVGLEKLSSMAIPLTATGPILVIGNGEVGSKVAQLLRDVDEPVKVVEQRDIEGVDVVGNALDPEVLRAADVESARAVILALDSGSPTTLAAALVRDLAPHAPVIARVNRHQDVVRAHRTGVDFALSFSEVASQLLLKQLVGEESLAYDPHVKLTTHKAGNLVGRSLRDAHINEACGCSVVAIRRGSELLVDFNASLVIEEQDLLHICATTTAQRAFIRKFDAERV